MFSFYIYDFTIKKIKRKKKRTLESKGETKTDKFDKCSCSTLHQLHFINVTEKEKNYTEVCEDSNNANC